MKSEIDVEAVEERLQNIPWGVVRFGEWSGSGTLTSRIMINLNGAALSQEYSPVPYASVSPDDDSNRSLNMVWLERDDYNPVAGFEISGGSAEGSIEKLSELPNGVDRIMVSNSRSESHAKKAENEIPDNFHYVDAGVWDV